MNHITKQKTPNLRKTLSKSIVLVAVIGFSNSVHYVNADQQILDDLIVDGSACIGLDCVNGENFNFDTIRLKENNVRIKFLDTSSTGGFPSFDWQLTANDSINGGENHFSIEDITSGTVPFKISAGAPNHSIYVRSNGFIGFNTKTPVVNLQTTTGNSPALRLEQDSSGGFTSQSWDVAGNETNFFVRDVTNGSRLPFRIQPQAPSNSLFIAADGDIGFETATPDGLLDIAHPSDANNHAVLVSPLGNFGINIDNGQNVNSLFEIQSTGGVSEFSVASNGNTNVNGAFTVSGDSTFNSNVFIDDSGKLGIGSSDFSSIFSIEPLLKIGSTAHNGIIFDATSNFTSSLVFSKQGSGRWILSSRNDFSSANDSLIIYNKDVTPVMSFFQDASVGFGVSSSVAGRQINTSVGAYLSSGGVWTNVSSREAKTGIMDLTLDAALFALEKLSPVTYEYKKEPGEMYVGFVAEDVPDLVATNNRKNMNSMDVVAVLTKVVQDQQRTIKSLTERLESLESKPGN